MRVYVEQPVHSSADGDGDPLISNRGDARSTLECSPGQYSASAQVYAWWSGESDGHGPWARVWAESFLLRPEETPMPSDAAHVILWSGTVGADLWSRDPGNWMSPGSAALGKWIECVESKIAAGGQGRLWLTPHCRHVLSDIPSVDRFIRESGSERVGIALEPAALFEEDMIEDRRDHLERILNRLGGSAGAVIVSDRVVTEGDEDTRLRRCRIGAGVFPPDEMLELIGRHVPESTPIIVRDGGQTVDGARRGELSRLLGAFVPA